MKLFQIKDNIWVSEYEEERDRPALGYIQGKKYSVAIDAGHSIDHIHEFYEALEKEGLPLPSLTILTHWHWDHTFAMHGVRGLTIANQKTDEYLREFIYQMSPESDKIFLHMDPTIEKEYEDGKPLVVVPADIVFEKQMRIDAGDEEILLSTCTSPHTDDSTLVYLPKEKILFFGDARSGIFPTWKADPKLLEEFIKTMKDSKAELFAGGHWPVYRREDFLKELEESLEEAKALQSE